MQKMVCKINRNDLHPQVVKRICEQSDSGHIRADADSDSNRTFIQIHEVSAFKNSFRMFFIDVNISFFKSLFNETMFSPTVWIIKSSKHNALRRRHPEV